MEVKNLKIAICDDDSLELFHISSILDRYMLEKKVPVKYKTFQSATELLVTMKAMEYEIIFLDILMPGVNGIQTATEIRQANNDVKIIFLTSTPEFAFESYAVKANDYLLKPASPEKLFPILDTLLSEEQNPQEGITLKTKKGIVRILFSNLAFVEVMSKKLYFHLSNGDIREVTASLSEVEDKLLCRSDFIKVHRSYIVNLWQIGTLTPKELVTHAGRTIPVSRLLYAQVREIYMEHLFEVKGVE